MGGSQVTRAIFELCSQRVGALPGQAGPDGRRRVVRHKFEIALGHQKLIDWCPGKFERREGT